MCSLFTSIFLYACESWTLTVDLQRIRTMEISCYRKILRISYKDRTKEEICAEIQQAIGTYGDLLTIVKRRKLKWYGHVFRFIRSGQNHLARHSRRGKKTRQTEKEVGRQQTSGNGQAWSSPSARGKWRTQRKKQRKLVVKSSVVPKRPPRLRDK